MFVMVKKTIWLARRGEAGYLMMQLGSEVIRRGLILTARRKSLMIHDVQARPAANPNGRDD
jgi:hypothetical protein